MPPDPTALVPTRISTSLLHMNSPMAVTLPRNTKKCAASTQNEEESRSEARKRIKHTAVVDDESEDEGENDGGGEDERARVSPSVELRQ